VRFCWKGVIEQRTLPVDPNLQQGNPCSFGVRELAVDEQEKRAAREWLPGQW